MVATFHFRPDPLGACIRRRATACRPPRRRHSLPEWVPTAERRNASAPPPPTTASRSASARFALAAALGLEIRAQLLAPADEVID